MFLRTLGTSACLLVAVGLSAGPAAAQVVAFGASNVSGYGVDPSETFVSVLQSLLDAKGYRVSVVNAGVYGDTTAQMLDRLDSDVPSSTTVVILDESGGLFNDRFHHISQAQGAADMTTITARLKSRGIVVIPMSGAALPSADHQADGVHLNAAGHRLIAQQLLPEVISALGPPQTK
ncbi:MAG TPA: GDSL-type esterase/lipase family protein [Caulobacteraceae bacterium]|nr:GDSL-type esterase/lipase family protein [Caulobacteraceae bacterium]